MTSYDTPGATSVVSCSIRPTVSPSLTPYSGGLKNTSAVVPSSMITLLLLGSHKVRRSASGAVTMATNDSDISNTLSVLVLTSKVAIWEPGLNLTEYCPPT